MKFPGALFEEDDSVNIFNMFIIEFFLLDIPQPFVLAKEQVGRIAGAALPRAKVKEFLLFVRFPTLENSIECRVISEDIFYFIPGPEHGKILL